MLTGIVDSWIESEDAVEEFERPEFPIFGSETADNRSELDESIAKGRKLFLSEEAACELIENAAQLLDEASNVDVQDAMVAAIDFNQVGATDVKKSE